MTPTPDAPTVSVVIPAHNAAWCVARAIDSVLAQRYRDFEVIVVDDGSTDETGAVVARYVNAVRLISQPNGGMSSARNAGIHAARGRYVAFLDADDRWLPDKLARQLALLEAHPELAFCAAVATLENPEGVAIGEWRGHPGPSAGVSEVFANHAAVAGGASAVVARKQLVAELGGFDERLSGAEDTDLWIRLAARGGFACIDTPMVVVLRRPGSVSRNLDAMRRGALAMTRKNRHLLPPPQRHAFWRRIYAGLLCDYAKWAYREGRHGAAARDLVAALVISPRGRGRLALGLLAAMIGGRHV